ncbi:Trypsin-like peptidase domain-containing protein [Treponema bryantii]|uniref:Trypsin-like peptidase domain-containing protein n=1 Tax=Treponema bryantii TaxID=163 RepID=A0A1H9ISL5_9SPIR|nr:serine protease [Treponema bryantii]SEQ77590.1 Trypsin-like peptidase domain-containing protein [Treponema bryantii]
MADTLEDYQKQFPNLISDIIDFFDASKASNNNKLQPKKVVDFCTDKNKKVIYQPQVIDQICKILCKNNAMSCINNTDGMGINNTYLVFNRSKNVDPLNKNLYYNSIVYGFTYIYNFYKDYVKPVVTIDKDKNYHCGTAFLFWNGIVTAKHCIEDVTNLRISGFSAKELNNAKIYISDNPGIDIAYIELQRQTSKVLLVNEGEILQDVLVMGYPKIPTFTDFLTAETASISSKAELRITPTKGNISAKGYQYLNKVNAMLITAKIRGGNSGGPVINSKGQMVGIACQLPDYNGSQGDYDDLGYGIALPFSYLTAIIEKKPKELIKGKDFFQDFS